MPPGSNARSLRSLALTFPLDPFPESPHLKCKDIIGHDSKRLCQKYRGHEDFDTYATTGEMLNFQCDKGEHEVFGAYFRNLRMEYAAAHPEEYKHKCGERRAGRRGSSV